MPANDVQTNLTIALQTKGIEKGLREILNVNKANLEGMKKSSAAWDTATTKIKGMEKQVQSLAKEQIAAQKAMSKEQDKGSDEYKKQEDRMKKAAASAKLLRQEMKLLADTHKDDAKAQRELHAATQKVLLQQKQMRDQAKWAGTQGFMQGAGLGGMAGMFMQRGPGFWRQAAGQAAGGMLRRAGGAAQGLAFGGIGGLQQALSSIPGGGIVAGQLGAVAGHSQKALQWQRERLNLAPMFGENQAMMAAGQRKIASAGVVREAVRAQGLKDRPKEGDLLSETIYGRGEQSVAPMASMFPGVDPETVKEAAGQAAVKRATSQRQIRIDIAKRMEEEGRAEIRGSATQPFQVAGRLGRRYLGLGRQESAQRVGQLYQVAGGRFGGDEGQRRDVGAAMAAQTMFGVQAETSGAFLKAGRRGGLVGGRGQGAEALTSALSDAMAMGLEGSEITKYMQVVAQGIQNFEQTGIPFNKDSIKSMTMEMGKAGIGGTRGAAMAGGLQQYVQGIGERGITGGMDLRLMQAFGGFKGGGAGDYRNAIIQMESMKGMGAGDITAGSALGKMVGEEFTRAGGVEGGGDIMVRKLLGRAGMRGSQAEISAMIEQVTGAQILTPEQRATMISTTGAEGKTGPKSVEQLLAQAAKRVTDMGPNLRKQASIMDKQLDVGAKALTAVQNLETSSLNLNDTFMFLAGTTLTDFSQTMNEVTTELGKLIKEEGGLLGAIRKKVFGI